ncbi:MAG: cytochrome ubiquinol oxidase subunit I [Candidatus Xenobia bacterium]|jgi:cytochrome d ubiquinol oxidase subunit I
MDVVILSRLQFAMTIMFHYLFPPLTIGLSVLMVVAEGLYLKTKDVRYLSIAHFWTKLFGVTFVMGVATGIVNQFQFGTNWAAYSRFVGDIFGTALASEGIFAFFLETGFFGVVVFGWNRVSPRFHFFCTTMVMFGGIFSSIWIVIANSWMQTPAGYTIVGTGLNARAHVTDFWAMVLNPSTVDRLVHVWLAAFVLGAYFSLAISAWYALRKQHPDMTPIMLRLGLFYAAIACTLVMVSGDSSARMVAQHQPTKLAAFEGHFETGTGRSSFALIGWPDKEAKKLRYAIEIPWLLSILTYHSLENKPVPGLDQTPEQDWPPLPLSFFSFHLMAFLGVYMATVAYVGLFFHWRKSLERQRWLLVLLMMGAPAAFLANEAGWVAAEVGRQPWIVYKLLRTSDAISEAVQASHVLASILMFLVIYFLMGLLWLYTLKRRIQAGPEVFALGTNQSLARGWADSVVSRAKSRVNE